MVDDELVELLRELLAIPSVNPAHCDDPKLAGEQRIAEFTGDWLEKLGFEIEYQAVEPGRPNVLARYGDFSQGRNLLLESHLDTVSVAGMKHDPFEAEIHDNRLYARGASDCKGAMAAALYALSQVDLPGLRQAGCGILFAGTMGEETGNCGARYLAEHCNTHFCHSIILEPTDLEIIHTHKGVLWCEVVIKGHSAHGSHPENGINAVLAATSFVTQLSGCIQKLSGSQHHPVLGGPTLNVGTIQGGTAVNIVPAVCVVSLDRRLLPGEQAEELLDEMKRILERIRENGECLEYTINVKQQVPPFESDADSQLVRILQEGGEKAGHCIHAMGAAWCSDAAVLCAHSDHTVVFGPGSIRQAHAAIEYIDLNELRRGSRILQHYFSSACW
jgi:acetylornithine deacetylase ArgE